MVQVLHIVSVLIILGGITGVATRQTKIRMLGVAMEVAGIILLVNCQGSRYGFFAGLELLIYGIPVLIMFLVTFGYFCKKNSIQQITELYGLRKSQPWLFLLYVIMGMILIGIPGTGTFGAYMLAIPAMLENGSITSYIGVFGMLVGIVMLGIQFYDLWIHMFLTTNISNGDTDEEVRRDEIKLNKPVLCICTIILLIVTVFGVYQNPVMLMISKLIESI